MRQSADEDHMVRRAGTSTIVFQPVVAKGLLHGVSLLTAAIRPTLGPSCRRVAIERPFGPGTPELLDAAGLIARRITEIPNREMNVGAMLLRQVLLEQQDAVGDGVATTAVVFEAALRAGLAEITAGVNAQQLREAVARLLPRVRQHLLTLASPADDPQVLANVAASVCGEPLLAGLLAEVVATVGEDGTVEIRAGHRQEMRAEYLDGAYWEGGLLSGSTITDTLSPGVDVEQPLILVSDLAITEPDDLLPLLELVRHAGSRALVIVARELNDRAVALLRANQRVGEFAVVAVQTPGVAAPDRLAALQDLATLTGARPCLEAAADHIDQIRLEHLGRSRRAWANRSHFGLIGGQGSSAVVRTHLASVRQILHGTTAHDDRAKLRKRLGRLRGASAIVWVGAGAAADTRKELAKRTIELLQLAGQAGVVPGGGAALLACARALHGPGADPTESAARRVLVGSLQAPARAIIENAGYEAAPILERLDRSGVGHGFDVRSGQIVDMAQAGVLDVGTVMASAIERAVSGASQALTVDVLVHARHRAEAAAHS